MTKDLVSDDLVGKLRDGFNGLIDFLVSQPVTEAQLREASSVVGGSRAGNFSPKTKGTYDKLFGFPEGNRHKYLGHKSTRPIARHHVERVVRSMAALGVSGLPAQVGYDLAGWVECLEQVRQAVEGHFNQSPVLQARVLPHPQWRFVDRAKLADAVIEKLQGRGVVAITGMSGAGKTVLGQQVAARLLSKGEIVHQIDAAKVLSDGLEDVRKPAFEDYIPLWRTLLVRIAESVGGETLPPEQLALFKTHVNDLRRRLKPLQQRSDGEASLWIDGEAGTWKKICAWIAESPYLLDSLGILKTVAEILRLSPLRVTAVIDDVWNFEVCESIADALFGKGKGDITGPCLIVTTQEAGQLNRLDGVDGQADFPLDADARAGGLGGTATDRDFARRVVAAWAAPGEDDLPVETAKERIDARHQEIFGTEGPRADEIDKVIGMVGGHPLALAALASAWRSRGYMSRFWREAAADLENTPEDLLVLEPGPDVARSVATRHLSVLGALRFAWTQLDAAAQQQYLDLVIAPRGEVLNEEIFHVLWERKERSGKKLSAAGAGSVRPMARFAAVSLLKPGAKAGVYLLHDLHRLMIEGQLPPDARARRHLDLLSAVGLVRDGRVHIDEERYFRLLDDERTILWPEVSGLDEEDSDEERGEIGQYLLQHLPHHLAAMGDLQGAGDALAKLLGSYRFLQARLDGPLPGNSGDRRGNVDNLYAALSYGDTPDVRALTQSIRLSASPLARDRRELAFQLLGRLREADFSGLEHLRKGAGRHCPPRQLLPRFPCLTSPSAGLKMIGLHSGEVNGAAWIESGSCGPAILSWSSDHTIRLWDPVTGRQHEIEQMRHGRPVWGAAWIASSPGGPAILSWSQDHTIRLWDPVTGRQHEREKMFHGRPVRGATWIESGPDGPAILSWSDLSLFENNTVRLWDPVTGRQHEIEQMRHDGSVHGAAWIESGSCGPAILSWSSDHTIRLWDPVTGRQHEIEQMRHDGSVDGAAWIESAPGGPAIMSWSDNGTIRLWDPVTGRVVSTMSFDTGIRALKVHFLEGKSAIVAGLNSGYLAILELPDRLR